MITSTVILIILWTWGLTPLWVNILCTVLLVGRFIVGLIIKIIEAVSDGLARKADKDTMEMVKKYFNK